MAKTMRQSTLLTSILFLENFHPFLNQLQNGFNITSNILIQTSLDISVNAFFASLTVSKSVGPLLFWILRFYHHICAYIPIRIGIFVTLFIKLFIYAGVFMYIIIKQQRKEVFQNHAKQYRDHLFSKVLNYGLLSPCNHSLAHWKYFCS